MKTTQIVDALSKYRIVPVIAIDKASDATLLADALIAGKLPVAEITFRTPAAVKVIKTLATERRQMIIGAGTILTIQDLHMAVDAGAAFGVAPGFNLKIVEEAARLDFPFVPGVTTPTEIEAALDAGTRFVKFFPAEAAGGIKMLQSLVGPYAHTGIRFMPTGGITKELVPLYLAIKQVFAVGASWIASRSNLNEGNWQEITDNCLLSGSQTSTL